jgi:hypothetical protein
MLRGFFGFGSVGGMTGVQTGGVSCVEREMDEGVQAASV